MSSDVVALLRSLVASPRSSDERAWTISIWSAMPCGRPCSSSIVRDAYTGFRLGSFDLGNMVQAVWSTAHGTAARDDQARRASRSRVCGPCRSVSRAARAALGGLAFSALARARPGRRRRAGRAARLLARSATNWLRPDRGTARTRLPRLSVDRHERDRGDPSGHFRDHVPSLLRVVPRSADRPFHSVASLVDVSTGELMGLPIAGLGIWYALARGGASRARHHRLRSRLDGGRPVPSSCRHSAAGDSIFYGFYDHVGGSPPGVLRKLATDPLAPCSARSSRRKTSRYIALARHSAALPVPPLARAGGRRSAAAPREWLLGLPLDDRPALPQRRGDRPLPGRRDRPRHRETRRSRRILAAAWGARVLRGACLVVGPWPRVMGLKPLGGREAVPGCPAGSPRAGDCVDSTRSACPRRRMYSGAHLSARRYVYSVPVLGRAEWVLVDRGDPGLSARNADPYQPPEVVDRLVDRLSASRDWHQVSNEAGVVLFRRVR